MGILLALLALVGVLTLGLLCYVITVFIYLFTLRFKKIFDYHNDIAVSLDQLGNVLVGLFANYFLIKKDSNEKFGNEDETLSDNIGDNKKLGKLKPLGKGIADGLNKIDPNHVEKASENNS